MMSDPNQKALPIERQPPKYFEGKYRAWKFWSSVWSGVHYIAGAAAAGLSAIVAANVRAKPPFLSDTSTLWVAIAAAVCSFVLTTLNPQKTANAYRLAYRHLEKAISLYQFNAALDTLYLSQAEREGIDMLQ